MHDATSSDPDVLARLRLLLPADGPAGEATASPADQPAAALPRRAVGPPRAGEPPGTGMSRAVPPAALPADPGRARIGPPAAFLVDGVPPRRTGPPWVRSDAPSAPAPARFEPAGSDRGGSGPDGPGPAGGTLTGLGAFDPGRRGAKALAAVAVIVVLIAASLAWRARPRVDPVPATDATASGAATAGTDTGGTPGGGAAPGGAVSGGARPDGATLGGAASSAAGLPDRVVVAVGGKVRRPGLVRLPPGARVADAVQAAGGAAPGVDVVLLNPARKVVDGELILVGVTPPPGLPTAAVAGAAPSGAVGPGSGPVNLNTATAAELDTLPGVGPVLAQRIVDHREQQGAFGAVGDLRQVEGIGNARYEQLKDLVTV